MNQCEIACLASFPGRMSRTDVCISFEPHHLPFVWTSVSLLAFVGRPWPSLACVGRHELLWACVRLDWCVVLVSEN
jgi:hypothetical protein